MQLRDYLPKTLFGRMLSIILIPMILVQVITIFIFYDRHWDTVTLTWQASLRRISAFLPTGLVKHPMKRQSS